MANGENVKIVQELMRHANCRSTLEIYSQARNEAKRAAQHRLVERFAPFNGGPAKVREALVWVHGVLRRTSTHLSLGDVRILCFQS